MLAAIPETAKRLSEQILNSDKPVIFRLQDVKGMKGKKGFITRNDFSALRRSIVFASGQPIIPEMVKGRGRSMAYRTLSDEEFKEYEFNERNFSSLTAKDIANIRQRVRQIDTENKYDKREFLKLLTICDIIIQWKGRSSYVEAPEKFLACSILESDKKTKEIVDFLIHAGILSKLNDTLRYNQIFRDVQDEDPSNVQSEKEYAEEIHAKIEDLKDIEAAIDACKETIVARRMAFEQQQTPEAEYRKKIKFLEEQLSKEQAKSDSFTVALSSYGKMKESYDELKAKVNNLEKKVEKYRKERNVRVKNVRTVLDDFSQKMTDLTTKFRRDRDEKYFTARTNALVVDTCNSIEVADSKI